MSTLQNLERTIQQLSLEDLAAFRAWFAEFDAQAWDQQFENDVKTGRLNHLAEKALQHLHAGRCTDL
ncbi:MAG: hypothetical protein AAGG51_05645 [Cyanobacteria bacterium P01_G01_bin.54]